MPRISKITTLSLPPKMVAEANKIAKEENRTKSELFREALRLYIEMRRWKKIREWGENSARAKSVTKKDINDLINDVRKEA